MRVDGSMRIAVGCMAVALLLMLTCLARPTPRTVAVLLGPGLGLGVTGICVFIVRVVRDLRARRML